MIKGLKKSGGHVFNINAAKKAGRGEKIQQIKNEIFSEMC